MLNYTIRRLLEAIPIWIAITLIVFILMNIIPGDPVAQLMDARSGALDENVIKQIREQWGLNDPLPLQYLHFLQGVVQGDFGTSYQSRSSVTELLMERIPVTLQITVLGLIIAIVIGITVGTIGALKRGTWIDSLVSSFSVSGVSLPSFFLGLILMYLFAVKIRLLPATGYVAGDIRYLLLPSLTLALAVSGVISRITRSAMIDILRMDYMTTAISKGISSGRIIILHALKNAMPPILTIIGVQMGLLLSGAVITETIFGLPGVGRLMIDAILQRDLPIVQGCVVFVATVFLLVNLLTDIGCRLIDPRIKVES
ncbi:MULTISPECIES: ABC transporter permease [Bacillaceae]|jgi:ABC-type dipeptide/oligopeptide/nickel transport system permease component|uniref:ABC transporter permease n=1 Tax=Niallia hominis TaxID=3133173 RepID=A0ABV1F4T2_9BACI|nr:MULTISPECIES: ABC transporter permease [Bacillaceae]MCF2650648.1 ABC transporter permease [Niallia circulans]MCM3364952.1 ABC transporter permease [Niallia sp. MER TA 168]